MTLKNTTFDDLIADKVPLNSTTENWDEVQIGAFPPHLCQFFAIALVYWVGEPNQLLEIKYEINLFQVYLE